MGSNSQVLLKAADRLAAVSESPRLDAELLLASVLKTNRAGLIARGGDQLTAVDVAAFEDLVSRRLTHEPIAYILGFKEFFSREIEVNPAVLIPRPETEQLVELVITRLRKIRDEGKIFRVFDIGCGSGAIGITIACELGIAVTLSDISSAGLALSAENAERHGVSSLVTLVESNLLSFVKPSDIESVDDVVVVANLPYIAEGETLPKDVVDFEPVQALFSGMDGLDAIRALIAQAAKFRPKIRLFLEHGQGSRFAIKQCAEAHGFSTAEYDDLAGRERILELW